jgi:dTDP-glucose pyrophosphorylase
MKAVILAAGRGKRLNEVTEDTNKCMLYIGKKKIILYSLDAAVDLGVTEIVLVVGYRAEEIINFMGNSYKSVPIKYSIQREQRGLVHAIECAAPIVDKSDFILLLADEIMWNCRRQKMIEKFVSTEAVATCGLVKRTDEKLEYIKRTYGVMMDEEWRFYRLIEKPRKIINEWQGTGNCVFSHKIFDYIDVCPIHHERNEKELPDLIQCAIDDGMKVYGFDLCDEYININSQDDLDILLKIDLHE